MTYWGRLLFLGACLPTPPNGYPHGAEEAPKKNEEKKMKRGSRRSEETQTRTEVGGKKKRAMEEKREREREKKRRKLAGNESAPMAVPTDNRRRPASHFRCTSFRWRQVHELTAPVGRLILFIFGIG